MGDASSDAGRDATGDAPSTPDAKPDGAVVEVDLTTMERERIKEQTEFEFETMLLEIRGTSAAAEVQTQVYRTTFAWGAQSMEQICLVNEEYPEGCRSGEKSLGGDFLFAAYEPDVTFDVTWSGKVGELVGESAFELKGVPTTWSDELPNEPNTESTFDISKHTQSVKIELVDAETQEHRWTRSAQKVFVENAGDVVLELAHEDTTIALATPIEAGFDVREIDYEARYMNFLNKDANLSAQMLSDGSISGLIEVDGIEWGRISGKIEQDDAMITIDWADE